MKIFKFRIVAVGDATVYAEDIHEAVDKLTATTPTVAGNKLHNFLIQIQDEAEEQI